MGCDTMHKDDCGTLATGPVDHRRNMPDLMLLAVAVVAHGMKCFDHHWSSIRYFTPSTGKEAARSCAGLNADLVA